MTTLSPEASPANPSPVLKRRRLEFHPLAVKDINRLTSDSVEIVFEVPPELERVYDYLPGQHIAVRAHHAGTEIRRSYSLCAPVGNGELHIGVKVEKGGIYSTFVNSELKVGDAVEVMTPQGSFTTHIDPASRTHIASVAAGSGITPVMALATAVLTGAPNATFTLVYSSRSADQVMFVDRIADLKDLFPDRFSVHHVLTREQRFSPMHTGRLDPARLDVLFDRLVWPATVDEWFLCGPVDLVQELRQQLTARGTDPIDIHVELFTTGALRREITPASAPVADLAEADHVVTMTLTGRTTKLGCGEDERILDAALAARADTPFSCTGGVCGTCRAKLKSGTVDMAVNYALEPEEIEAGYILTCQSVCTSKDVEVDYDA